MSRVEVIGNATLYLGDCRDVLPSISYDACVTDPPYGIDYKPKTRSTKSNDGYAGGRFETAFAPVIGDAEAFDPSHLISNPAILWGANNYAARLPDSNGWLCWYKAGGIKGFNMSEVELAWTNVRSSTAYIDHLWHGFKRASQVGEKVNHPTEKPVAVMQWCVAMFPAHYVIADPYMGAGATGVAAAREQRAFIGCEIHEHYFDIACRRIEDAQRQGSLFAA